MLHGEGLYMLLEMQNTGIANAPSPFLVCEPPLLLVCSLISAIPAVHSMPQSCLPLGVFWVLRIHPAGLPPRRGSAEDLNSSSHSVSMHGMDSRAERRISSETDLQEHEARASEHPAPQEQVRALLLGASGDACFESGRVHLERTVLAQPDSRWADFAV